MAQNVILARMGEVTLKGLNRGKFEIQLKSNLKYRLRHYGKLSIFQSQSRIWVEAKEEGNPYFENDESAKELLNAVTQVFGIVSASLARKFDGDMESVLNNASEYVAGLLSEHPEYKTFKVESK
ncbi:MAG: tRNA 4-thiouridine(8) synthase ThiI, partial [Clostridiales bacterium]|nr:tRNA 4-thiouridine(8) synthase ThiI [Clostridiales bacterium]